jgi:hypothetical protein
VSAGSDILDQLHATLIKYLVFPCPEAADAVTLWVAASHAQPAWEYAPRLNIQSPMKRCGKSRLLDLIEVLCEQPMMMIFASAPTLFRSIDPDEPPTLLLDETDAIFGTKDRSESQEAMRAVLNAGHQRGRTVPRCIPPSQRVEHFPTFAMAALAGIGDLPDTIKDRSVVIRLRRRAPGETVARMRLRRLRPELYELRDQLHQWVRDHLDELRDSEPDMPLDDRAADTWEPLFAIADLAGDEWHARAWKAATDLNREDDAEMILSVRLLRDLRDVFDAMSPSDKAFTETLLVELYKMAEAPWAEYFGHSFNPRDLARLLKPYEVQSRDVKISGVVKKGYRVEDLWDAWRRYLPAADDFERDSAESWPGKPGGTATSATSATSGSDLGFSGSAFPEVALPPSR